MRRRKKNVKFTKRAPEETPRKLRRVVPGSHRGFSRELQQGANRVVELSESLRQTLPVAPTFLL